MDGLAGCLLVAPAWMIDPNFAKTVVLLLHHDGQGAFGLVLNRPTGTTVAELWAQAAGGTCDVKGPIHLGGPVPGPLMALHEDPSRGESTPVDGLYATGEPKALGALLADPPVTLRVFAGYSGWGEGQLERELQDGAWVRTLARASDVFAPADARTWRLALRRGTESAHSPFSPPDDDGPGADAN
jgi:putative transcriptional regulator